MHVATLAIIHFIYLYIESITKTPIRMQGFIGWYAPMLFVCNKIGFMLMQSIFYVKLSWSHITLDNLNADSLQ